MTDPQTLSFDAGNLARGWLSAWLATGTNPELPPLYQTLCLEVFDGEGVRLTATDRYMLITAWVPLLDLDDNEPSLDEAPTLKLTFRDDDARAKGLLTYLRKIHAKAVKDETPLPTVDLMLGVKAEEGDTPGFPGMEREQVVLDFPGNESVRCDVIEANYPDWRPILAAHKPVKTARLVVAPELLARAAAVGRIVGPYVRLTPGGPKKMIGLEPSEGVTAPIIRGGLMPIALVDAQSVEDAAA